MSKEKSVHWEGLTKAYRENGLVLVLGSGVSVASGLPKWQDLLSRVARKIDDCPRMNDLVKMKFSLPAIASLLEELCENEGRNEFLKKLRKALYDEFLKDYGLNPLSPGSRFDEVAQRKFRRRIEREKGGNSTLRAVCALCATGEKGSYRPNEKIRAVVTFNIDWLIQAYDRALFGKILRTIERPSASPSSSRIGIYHLHGLMRFDDKQENLKKEAPDRVVITEQDYFDFFNDPISIFNYTFLHLLREYCCLFIGLSMQDDNLRRLLHYSKKERIDSLVDENGKRYDPKSEWPADVKEEIREKVTRHFAILSRQEYKDVETAVEKTLLPLGVRVLWINDFKEIPCELGEMYDQEHGAGSWQNVNGVMPKELSS